METNSRRGRPPKASQAAKSQTLLLRVDASEKEAFKDAAALAGISVSAWIRERLRTAAIRDLQGNGHPVAFLKHLTEE